MMIKDKWGNQNLRVIVGIIVILLPISMSVFIPKVLFNKTFFDTIPLANDEVQYWHEILTYSKVGFDGGYYGVNEYIAPAKFSHFHFHGPAFPVLFGTLGKIFGWQLFSGALFNIVFLTIALIVFVLIIKPDFKQSAFLGLLLLTFWPIHFYIPTIMQLLLHLAIAVLMAVLFRIAIEKGVQTLLAVKITTAIFIIIASLFRPMWSFLFFPLFLFSFSLSSRLRLALVLLGAMVASFVMMNIYKYLGGADPRVFILRLLTTLQSSFYAGLKMLLMKILRQTYYLFFSDTFFEHLLRYSLLSMIATFGFLFVRQTKNIKNKINTLFTTIQGRESIFHLLNLAIPLLFYICVGIIHGWGDYRVFAPHLLLSLLVLIASKRRLGLVGLIVGINLIGVTSFIPFYKKFHTERFIHNEQLNTLFINSINGFLQYEKEKSPWCNTMLSSVVDPPPFVNIPAGIGITFFQRIGYPMQPYKSRYLLLSKANYKIIKNKQNIELLTSTPYGNLYLNNECKCD